MVNQMWGKLLLTYIAIIACTAQARSASEDVNSRNRRQTGECTIDIKTQLPVNQPLLLRKGGTKDLFGFFLPDAQGIVHINAGEQMIVACPGKNNLITKFSNAQVTVTCTGGQYFSHPSFSQLTIADFNCASLISSAAKKSASEKCEINGNYSLIEIGFEIFDKSYYTLMKTCFDDKNADSLYSKFTLTPLIVAAEVGDPRPAFVEGTFYPSVSVNTKYTKESQKATFAQILGSQTLADQYIADGEYYISKGHLTARADFIYSSQQRATFWYVNAAPQWQTFNNGNWNNLEDNVRTYVTQVNKNLVVYTGTHGISTLPDVSSVQKQLYLNFDATNGNKLKIPELFWKIVYDPQTQKGIAFVGMNNPHVSTFTPLCTNVCYQINWLVWQPNDQRLGFSYCCDINQLKTVINTIPNLTVTGLLV